MICHGGCVFRRGIEDMASAGAFASTLALARGLALVLAFTWMLAFCCAPSAFAANVLSIDTSDMVVAVGEEAQRPYELAAESVIREVRGQSAVLDYSVEVISDDPNIVRGQAGDGMVRVFGYSGGSAQVAVQVIDPTGGVADEARFTVVVEGEDRTLDQAIIAVGDEEEAEAIAYLESLNGKGGPDAGASSPGQGAGASNAAPSNGSGSGVEGQDAAQRGSGMLAVVALVIVAAVAAIVFAIVRWRKGSKADAAAKCSLAVLVAFGATAGCSLAPGQAAWAYFDRGPVTVDIGQYEVVLNEQESASILCFVDPEFDDQLPGCGMASCPDECPEGCMDGRGQCTCGGMEYARWFTTVNVMSNDPSVARADWAGGSLVVSGYEPGVATITVTASLKQFQDASVSLQVVVNAAPVSEGTVAEDEYVGDGGASEGQGDAQTNVANGTGDADNAYLNADAGGQGSYDKPAASAPDAGAEAPKVPEAPEVPVEPDAARPVALYELEEVENEGGEAELQVDPGLAGATSAAACAFMAIGAVGATRTWRRERA